MLNEARLEKENEDITEVDAGFTFYRVGAKNEKRRENQVLLLRCHKWPKTSMIMVA